MRAFWVATVTIEGELTVRLAWDGHDVRSVTVRSTRPFAAARVLVGRAPAEAVATVRMLFSICGRAQEAASIEAIEAANGVLPDPEVVAGREISVLLETVQEYLWRILIDWPRAMGRDALVEPVAVARRRIAAALGATVGALDRATVRNELAPELVQLTAQHVYGEAHDTWIALTDADALAAWAARAQTLPALLLGELLQAVPTLGRSDVALMPAPRREALLVSVLPAMRDNPGFERAPDWAGFPVETGALARMQTHPLVASLRARCGNAVPARMAARLVELTTLLGHLSGTHADAGAVPWIHAFAPKPGEGVAAVQTARGLLLHRVQLAGGRVTGYQIVAPTEWNFHPEGPLTRGLAGLVADDAATIERQARLAVQALDPCVACNVEVAHA